MRCPFNLPKKFNSFKDIHKFILTGKDETKYIPLSRMISYDYVTRPNLWTGNLWLRLKKDGSKELIYAKVIRPVNVVPERDETDEDNFNLRWKLYRLSLDNDLNAITEREFDAILSILINTKNQKRINIDNHFNKYVKTEHKTNSVLNTLKDLVAKSYPLLKLVRPKDYWTSNGRTHYIDGLYKHYKTFEEILNEKFKEKSVKKEVGYSIECDLKRSTYNIFGKINDFVRGYKALKTKDIDINFYKYFLHLSEAENVLGYISELKKVVPDSKLYVSRCTKYYIENWLTYYPLNRERDPSWNTYEHKQTWRNSFRLSDIFRLIIQIEKKKKEWLPPLNNPNLLDLHDKLAKVNREIAALPNPLHIDPFVKDLHEKIMENKYKFIIPFTDHDTKDWSKKMSNCISGYHPKENEALVAVLDIEKADKMIYNMHIRCCPSTHKISVLHGQFKAFGNGWVDDKTQKLYLKFIEKQAKKSLKKEEEPCLI